MSKSCIAHNCQQKKRSKEKRTEKRKTEGKKKQKHRFKNKTKKVKSIVVASSFKGVKDSHTLYLIHVQFSTMVAGHFLNGAQPSVQPVRVRAARFAPRSGQLEDVATKFCLEQVTGI